MAHTTKLNYKLSNIVYSAKLAKPVNIDTILVLLDDVKISGRNSSVHMWRKCGTFLIQKSGRVLIFKCFSQSAANDAARNLVNELNELLLLDTSFETEPVICNMVGNWEFGFKVDLYKLRTLMPKSFYEPELHVSLFATVAQTKVTITHTGKCIIFGAKKLDEFERTVRELIDKGNQYMELRDVVLSRFPA